MDDHAVLLDPDADRIATHDPESTGESAHLIAFGIRYSIKGLI